MMQQAMAVGATMWLKKKLEKWKRKQKKKEMMKKF